MVNKCILISSCHMKDQSPIVGSWDFEFIVPFIRVATDIDISEIVGEALLRRICQGVIANDLNPYEITLLEDYIQPALVHFAMFRGMNHLVFKVDNSGLVKRDSENGTSADLNESSFLAEQEKTIAESYGRRLADFIEAHASSYPEYKAEMLGEITPSTTARFGGGLWLGRTTCDTNTTSNVPGPIPTPDVGGVMYSGILCVDLIGGITDIDSFKAATDGKWLSSAGMVGVGAMSVCAVKLDQDHTDVDCTDPTFAQVDTMIKVPKSWGNFIPYMNTITPIYATTVYEDDEYKYMLMNTYVSINDAEGAIGVRRI